MEKNNEKYCINCVYSRLPCNKNIRNEYVGCNKYCLADLSDDDINILLNNIEYKSPVLNIYSGWIYAGLSPSDKEEDRNTIINFMLITHKYASCKEWKGFF